MKKLLNCIFLVLSGLFLLHCSVPIDKLRNDIFSFEELPDSVKLIFVHANEYSMISNSHNLLYSDSSLIYDFNIVKSIGSFIDYYEVKKEGTSNKIRIPYGKILPFVIHQNILYIPTDYNVQNNLSNARRSRYEVYYLPDG